VEIRSTKERKMVVKNAKVEDECRCDVAEGTVLLKVEGEGARKGRSPSVGIQVGL